MSYEWDSSIICPKDPTATPERIAEYKTHYRVKHGLARECNPQVIVEIGVRCGYSAWAFLTACPDAKYHGFDADNGTHGGQGGPWTWWAEKILAERKFDFEIHAPFDTQDKIAMPVSADFYHIDGDHTVKGVQHDLDICWEAANGGAVLLVDDYDYIDDVKQGVDEWLAARPEIKWKHVPSLRGEIVIKKDWIS